MKERTNRVYVADFTEWGVVCIAPSLHDAKQIFWKDSDIRDQCDYLYINLAVSWRRDLEAGDVPVGIPDTITALRAELYGCIHEDECPECGDVADIIYDGDLGMVACENCIELNQDEVDEEMPQLANDDYVDTEVGG